VITALFVLSLVVLFFFVLGTVIAYAGNYNSNERAAVFYLLGGTISLAMCVLNIVLFFIT
jgi:hypothetical protein